MEKIKKNLHCKYVTANDIEAVNAFFKLSETERIIPALESSPAIAYTIKLSEKLINLSFKGYFILGNFQDNSGITVINMLVCFFSALTYYTYPEYCPFHLDLGNCYY